MPNYTKAGKIPLWVHITIYILLVFFSGYTMVLLHGESTWIEGDAYVTFVYEYNLPFWRICVSGQASDIHGEFYASSQFNISQGWWHLIIKGGVIINAWSIDV